MQPTFFATPAEFRAWLERHHADRRELLVGFYKTSSGRPSITWPESVDEALCFGWIDGQARKRDEGSSWRRLTPRRPRSVWSQRNVANVARLEAAGLMLPAGRAAVDAAKADGRWTAAYAPSSEAEVPADLQAAIAADPAAQAMFDVLTKTNRFALIGRVNAVKRAETRTRKIAECVAMLARHETIHPQRARPADPPTS
jgi:uncharacterized protein YdeI (YjbR/CyaY-like superfamily)